MLYKKQKHKIHGFKFHQYALDILREEVDSPSGNKPLDASAVAVYIGLMSEVTEAGLLVADFNKSKLAEKLNMTRQTVHDGFNQLLERGFIKLVELNESTQYEIYAYAAHNLSKKEGSRESGINYFRVPFELFNSAVISKLVSSRESKGLIFLLELFNFFSRELKKNKEQVNDYSVVRTMCYLKERLGKSSSIRARKCIDILSPLFAFTPDKVVERKPHSLEGRIRKAVTQLWINKYTIHIKPSCVIESDEVEIEATKALKDAEYRIKALKIPMIQKDRVGIRVSYNSFVREISKFVEDTKLKKQLLQDSMQIALSNLEYLVKTDKLQSLGAYINSQLEQFVYTFLDKNVGLATDIRVFSQKMGINEPSILERYAKHLKKKNVSFN
jgi:DNA-binding Lrp family transcriptional regulator